MGWVKGIIIDLVVAALVVIAAVAHQKWAWWIIAVYTPVMLALKLMVWASPGLANLTGTRNEQIPRIVLHLLFAVCFAFSIVGGWEWLAICWAAIWLLSATQDMRQAPVRAKAKK